MMKTPPQPPDFPQLGALESIAWRLTSNRGQGYVLLLLVLKHLHDRALADNRQPLRPWRELQEEEDGLLGALDALAAAEAERSPTPAQAEFLTTFRFQGDTSFRSSGLDWLRAALYELEGTPLASLGAPAEGRGTSGEIAEQCLWKNHSSFVESAGTRWRGLPAASGLLQSGRMMNWVDTLLVSLLYLGPDTHIYDPVCGEGHRLLRCVERVEERMGMRLGRKGGLGLVLSGRSDQPEQWATCRMRLLLHGLDGGEVLFQGGVSPPAPPSPGSVDAIVANLLPTPRAERNTTVHGGEETSLLLRESASRIALLEESLEALRRGGTAAFAVPSSFGDRGGDDSRTRQLRRRLIEEGLLTAVLRLPARLGLVLVLSAPDQMSMQHRVLFVDPPRDWSTASKLTSSGWKAPSDPLGALCRPVLAHRMGKLPWTDQTEVAFRAVEADVIRDRGGELTPEAYLDHLPAEAPRLGRREIQAQLKSLADLEQLRDEAWEDMDRLLPQVSGALQFKKKH